MLIWGKKWGGVWGGAYICSSGVLPGVMWDSTLERRWVAIVRVLCVVCEDGEIADGRSVVGIHSRLQRRRQIVSLGPFGHSEPWSSAGKRASVSSDSAIMGLGLRTTCIGTVLISLRIASHPQFSWSCRRRLKIDVFRIRQTRSVLCDFYGIHLKPYA